MENIALSDPLHDAIMQVLIEFKVLTTDLLRREVNYKGKADSFRKVLRLLLGKRHIDIIRENRRLPNYVFIRSKKIDEASLFHDLKVAEIALKLRDHPLNPTVTLSHFLDTKTFLPDALLQFPHGNIFLEIELTMKSESKIRKKIEHYLLTPANTQVFYIFRQERDLRRYKEVITSAIEEFDNIKNEHTPRRKFILILINNIHEEFNIYDCPAHVEDTILPLGKLLRVDEHEAPHQ